MLKKCSESCPIVVFGSGPSENGVGCFIAILGEKMVFGEKSLKIAIKRPKIMERKNGPQIRSPRGRIPLGTKWRLARGNISQFCIFDFAL